jgi:mono/diheme cytochrome c family protein
MLPQNFSSEQELDALISYIKSFSQRFSQLTARKPISLPQAPLLAPARIQHGASLYLTHQCVQCHGPEGKGNGVLAQNLAIKPADLTRRPLKVGATAHDIARTILTGLEGTPMPPYQFLIDGEELWDLAYYIHSLDGPTQETED